jgi:hypothetical protein
VTYSIWLLGIMVGQILRFGVAGEYGYRMKHRGIALVLI